jgi:hypothetical protein
VVGCFENGAPPKMKIEKKTFSDMISQAGENVVLVEMNIHGSEYAVLMSTPPHVP